MKRSAESRIGAATHGSNSRLPEWVRGPATPVSSRPARRPGGRTPPGPTDRDRAILAAWFWTGAALTFCILVIGGITRLTQSGLSMVDWEPLTGVLPPIGEAQWQDVFDRYRQYPEYRMLRPGMTLDEFRLIFFWEYLHRLAARAIGIVFLVPFLFFLSREYLDRRNLRRALVLFGLGGLQGFAGWFMVSSGLTEQPHVSHYRLAVHLSIAFAIFASCVWFALDLGAETDYEVTGAVRSRLIGAVALVGGLLGPQIFWGALVAGLNAGYILNTFPLMGGSLMPPGGLAMRPMIFNLVENPVTVQWLHRVVGTALALAAINLFFRVRRLGPPHPLVGRLNIALLGLIAVQYGLGVVTLLLRVPVPLGVLHQANAMILFGVWLALLHEVKGIRTSDRSAKLRRE